MRSRRAPRARSCSEHFNPDEAQQPSGPLYGVQFSQLVVLGRESQRDAAARVGPKRSPLGLVGRSRRACRSTRTASLVGGIGVEADGVYGLDLDIADVDADDEEAIAVAGSVRLRGAGRHPRATASPPTAARCATSTRSRSLSDPAHAPAFATLAGRARRGRRATRRRAILAGHRVRHRRFRHRAADAGAGSAPVRCVLVDARGNEPLPAARRVADARGS